METVLWTLLQPGTGSVVTIKVFDLADINPVTHAATPRHQFLGFESTFKNSVSLTLGEPTATASRRSCWARAGGSSRVRVFDTFGTLASNSRHTPPATSRRRCELWPAMFNGGTCSVLAQSNDGRSRTIQGFNPLTGALVDAFLDTDVAFNPGEWLG